MSSVSFFLMGFKGLSVLRSIEEEFGTGFISKVITAHDPGVQNDYCDDIRDFCREKKIECYLKEDKPEITSLYAFAISWRWLIDDNRKFKLIVLHDSILPKNRGFNPLVTSLINGDKEIGVTALFSAEKYDSGPIIEQRKFAIDYPCKIQQAIEIVSNGYSELVKSICLKIKEQIEITAFEQNEDNATFSLWRDNEDYKIDWNLSAEQIVRFIDAVGHPYSGACTSIDGQLIRILQAEPYPDKKIENRVAGKLIFFDNHDPIIVCGKGLLRIRSMQAEDGQNFNLKKFRIRFK